jgi:hypothetical protein
MRIQLTACLLTFFVTGCGTSPQRTAVPNDTAYNAKHLYWGDLHNHNSIGQIKGSLERSYDIARSHLDFFAFTPQSQWMDMIEIPEGRNAQFVRGFTAVKQNWERIKEFADKYNQPGKFVSFIGYEVHGNYGDFHILFPGPSAELVYLPNVKDWQNYAKDHGAILVPHHPAYKPGWRGTDWGNVDPEVSPVVEILSEHGNAESDRSPIRYIRHSMGGRYTKSTVQWLWSTGVKAGVVASTDDHLGYPGAYGEGLAAVYADSLTRESLMEAIKARRTYAVNADRIQLDFKLNGKWMGETIPSTPSREIRVTVKGKDVVDRVEVLRNNRVIYRDHPIDREPGPTRWDKPVLCRIEFGWGPWADFNMPRTCDWKFKVAVKGGKILSASPHFQSRPFDEERRDKIVGAGDDSVEVTSFTSRQNAFEERPTKDIVLEIQGSPDSEVVLTLTQPKQLTFKKSLKELAEADDILFTGAFSSESVMFHRVVFPENYMTEFSFEDKRQSDTMDWYYVRVTQTNGSMAWSSPIWVQSR